MIDRYSRKEMSDLWSERSKYLCWLEVEMAASEEMKKRGLIKPSQWALLKKKCNLLIKQGGVDPKRVEYHEQTTKHDVIAFTTAVAERVGPLSRFIHFGMTSSDVVDTAFAMQMLRAGDLILKELAQLRNVVWKKATRYKKLACIGRSHGMFAEPTSFGLKFLGFWTELGRSEERIKRSLKQLGYGKLSGAVGVNSHFSVAREKAVLGRLGLKREPVATQVIPRDRIASLMNDFSILGGAIERMAVEFRHLQRSEVGELQEGFSKGQKGSSAMPHKKNPISSENLTGCARMLRSFAHGTQENIALWHERDISHSAVERVFVRDAFILLDYTLARAAKLVDGMVVNEERVAQNLRAAGNVSFSGHILLALCEAGAIREKAYLWVQRCAHEALAEPQKTNFLKELEMDHEVRRFLSVEKIRSLSSIRYQLKEVDRIYAEAKKAEI